MESDYEEGSHANRWTALDAAGPAPRERRLVVLPHRSDQRQDWLLYPYYTTACDSAIEVSRRLQPGRCFEGRPAAQLPR